MAAICLGLNELIQNRHNSSKIVCTRIQISSCEIGTQCVNITTKFLPMFDVGWLARVLLFTEEISYLL